MSVTFTDNSQEVLNAMERQIRNALTAIGMTAEGYAKRETPVDTGRLRNSMSHKVVPQEKSVYIGSDVSYAPYQELGTSRGVTAKHMLQKAATQHSTEYKMIAEQALQE